MSDQDLKVFVRLGHGDLAARVRRYQERRGLDGAKAVRELIYRGLFIEETPRGNWSETAWAAAIYEARAQCQQALHLFMTDPERREQAVQQLEAMMQQLQG